VVCTAWSADGTSDLHDLKDKDFAVVAVLAQVMPFFSSSTIQASSFAHTNQTPYFVFRIFVFR
jgi:hypothetical protein